MPLTRPLIALLAALSLLFALPAAEAPAKGGHGSKAAKSHVKKKHKKKKHKKHSKKKQQQHKAKQGSKPPRTHGGPGPADHVDEGGDDFGDGGEGGEGGEGGGEEVEFSEPVATISAVEGDLVTLELVEGGSVAAHVTEDTDLICDDGEEVDPGEEDPGFRSAETCTAEVGDDVYDYDIDDADDEPVFFTLSLIG